MHSHEYMHVACMYMRTYTCMQACMRPYTRAHTHIHAYACIHTSMNTHTCTYTCICMHICTCIRLEQRTMPDGNPLASAPGEDPFIQLKRTNQEPLPPFRASPPSLDHQSGGTRTHHQGAPVGTYTSKHQEEQSPSPQLAAPLNHHESGTGGGSTPTAIWIVRSGRPVPSGRTLAREGVVRLGAPCHLVPAARPRTPIKVTRSWRKCERQQVAVGAGSKIAPRDPFLRASAHKGVSQHPPPYRNAITVLTINFNIIHECQ